MHALAYLGNRLFGSRLTELDEFKITCCRHPRLALTQIAQRPDLAKNAPFDLLQSLASARTLLSETLPPYQDPDPTAEDILIALIDAGANVSGADPLTGHTLLHIALENGLAKAAVKLVGKGLDDKPLPSTGVTPLHLAALDGYRFRAVIDRLLQNNSSLCDRTTHQKSSPLHFAARAKSLDGVHLLLKAGIDARAKNSCFQTALDVANLVHDNLLVIARLQASKEEETRAFLAGCPVRPIELVLGGDYKRALYQLQQGDTFTDNDFSLLWATQFRYVHKLLDDYPAVVRQFSPSLLANVLKRSPGEATHFLCMKLIEMGIGVTGEDRATGKSALHFAVLQAGEELVTMLLDAKANPSTKDKDGNTPLHCSAESYAKTTDSYAYVEKRKKILQLLLERGANPMLVNNKGQLPLYIAQSSGWKLIYIWHAVPAACKWVGGYQGIIEDIKNKFKLPAVVQSYCTPDTTPLEAIFLLDLPAGPVLQQMQEEQRIHGIALLLKKYPDAHELILLKFFDANPTHIQTALILHTNPPKTVAKQDRNVLLTYFRKLEKMANSEEIERGLQLFLDRVKRREAYAGTPKEGSDALHDFYRIIRRALNNLVLRLDGKPVASRTVKDIATKLSEALCGVSYLTTALDLYNTYCLNIAPSLNSAFLEQLQVLRGVVLQKMLSEPYVRQSQSAHALAYFKRILGQELKLADRASFVLEDAYERSGFIDNALPDHEKLRKAFNSRYTTTAIYDWMYSLMADERYRNFYIDWAKQNLREAAPAGSELNEFLFVGESNEPNHIALFVTLIKLNVIKFKSK